MQSGWWFLDQSFSHCCFFSSAAYRCLRFASCFFWCYCKIHSTWRVANDVCLNNNRSLQIRSLEMWANIGCTKEQLGNFSSHFGICLFWVWIAVTETNIFCFSPLIPLPPVIYKNLPLWFKETFLFEFPLYSRNLPREEPNWWVYNLLEGIIFSHTKLFVLNL